MNQTIYNISQIFSKKGVKKMVFSPGSRNAPLTISFARNPDIKIYNIVDERSAGFIVLGMALKSREAVAICCTSGSALLNYAPAVSEAYYQEVPLIVISADRPPEWINQRDGQTINQSNALANFTKGFFQLPVDLNHEDSQWEFNRKINEAINLATSPPFGPVHINIPFREPFYPTTETKLDFGDVRIIENGLINRSFDFTSIKNQWLEFSKKLIVIGQTENKEEIIASLKAIKNATIVSDIISNCEGNNHVKTHDLFLSNATDEQLDSLRPELLITVGKSLISKNLKLFLRKYKPKEHWHFEDTDQISDTFKTLSHHFKVEEKDALVAISLFTEKDDFSEQLANNYKQNWLTLEKRTQQAIEQTIKVQPFSDTTGYYTICQNLKSKIDLHLANSMAVRYANFFQYALANNIEVFANRGTSGIDGSNGTAVGNAIIGDKPVVLLTGDLSFFYDRNAFFHQYNLSKLKIIVFNNGGGGIFRLIKGPAAMPELEQHFETRHTHSAKFTALEYGFDYHIAKDQNSLQSALELIFKDDKTPKLLEIFTDPTINDESFTNLKKAVFDALRMN